MQRGFFVEMIELKWHKNKGDLRMKITAKEIGFCAVVCALLLGGQFLLSMISGVEVVTVVLLCFAFSFGAVLGMLSATAFSLLRCLIWGFYPSVVLTYLIYYNLFCLLFGVLGLQHRKWKEKQAGLADENGRNDENEKKKVVFKRVGYVVIITLLACICTACFTLLDAVITPLFYAYTAEAAWGYLLGSLPFMVPQIICTAVTVGLFFLPLTNIFNRAVKK